MNVNSAIPLGNLGNPGIHLRYIQTASWSYVDARGSKESCYGDVECCWCLRACSTFLGASQEESWWCSLRRKTRKQSTSLVSVFIGTGVGKDELIQMIQLDTAC